MVHREEPPGSSGSGVDTIHVTRRPSGLKTPPTGDPPSSSPCWSTVLVPSAWTIRSQGSWGSSPSAMSESSIGEGAESDQMPQFPVPNATSGGVDESTDQVMTCESVRTNK